MIEQDETVHIGIGRCLAASVRTKEADLSDPRPEPLADSGEKRVKRGFDHRRQSQCRWAASHEWQCSTAELLGRDSPPFHSRGRFGAKATEDLDKKVIAVKERLFNLNATGRGQDFLRNPSQLMEKLAHLADTLQFADFAPTDQQLEVQKLLSDQVAAAAGDLNTVVSKDVATFNDMLRRRNVGTIIVR